MKGEIRYKKIDIVFYKFGYLKKKWIFKDLRECLKNSKCFYFIYKYNLFL